MVLVIKSCELLHHFACPDLHHPLCSDLKLLVSQHQAGLDKPVVELLEEISPFAELPQDGPASALTWMDDVLTPPLMMV